MNNIYQKTPFKYHTYLLIIIYTLIPLILMGFYKNGIMLYFKDLVKLIYIIKPLLFIFVSVIFGFIVPLIFKKKDQILTLVLYNLLISLCISINTNIYLYTGMILVFNILYFIFLNKIKINYPALVIFIISLTSYFVFNTSFLNHYEVLNNQSYSIIDFLFGFSVGGIGSSNILLILIGLVILSFTTYYKKDIAITGVVLYTICYLWGLATGDSFNELINLLCSYSVIFAIVYILPINEYSPKKDTSRYIYTALICFISFILVFFLKCPFAVYIAILSVNIMDIFIKIILKKRK